MAVKNVGVVGCGLMGSGIAEVCARSGYSVVVSEANQELLNRGLKALQTSLERAVKAGKLAVADRDAAWGRLRGTTRLEDFSGADMVIEAITENMGVKKEVYARLDAITPPHAILASNTSCLSVIDMAAATKRPDKVLGTHFFNPAPVMKLVEIVRTIATSPETLEQTKTFIQSLGKTVIVAPDAPGFIVNRLLIPYMLDAVRLLEAGVATREEIDQGMILGCSYPMGPFVLFDLVGLDTALYVADAMYQEFKDTKFAAPPLLRKMVTAGRLGRKTGRGFYEYTK